MKKLLLVMVVLVISLAFWWRYQLGLPLVDPFWLTLRPNLTRELSAKVSSLNLDFSETKTVKAISGVRYLVYETETGRVLAASDSAQTISPASFTKLLTAMVALDVATATAKLTATDWSVNKEPTVLGLKVGEELTIADLVRAGVATSANDAAATLAFGVADLYKQPVEFFVELMNQKAQLIGMRSSYFANSEGYDSEQQFTTLEDVARLVHNASLYPLITTAGKSDREDIETSDSHGHYYLPNWNGLLKVYPGVNGLKIAYTGNAGYSTIVTANRQGYSLVVILTGAASIEDRDLLASQLLDFGFKTKGLSSVNLDQNSLKPRYKEWRDLAAQIRSKLEAE